MIVTENMVYKDYYSISGNTGKVSLVHNELVKKQIGKRNILDTTTFENG